HGPRGGDHHERFFERYAERLGVDDETRAEIEEKFDASREQAEPLRLAVREVHRELHEMLRADEPDRAAILDQADRIGELEGELRKLRLTTLLDVRSLLTEEQRAEMVSIHEERMRARLEPLLEACAEDVDALCPDVEDPRSLMLCMRERRDELSESCRDALGKGRRGRHGHFRRGDPDGPPRGWDEG
ncbi:MAG: Spy/CpxP family protein refolding chaperone, partial [Myxococcota bacterium]